MSTKTKIKIKDNVELRRELDQIYDNTDQVILAKWAISVAKRILKVASIGYSSIDEITNGFQTNERWQVGQARMFDVRQAGFKVHRLAKESDNPIETAALRTAGQAIGTGHMREHAMVCSDYAVKTIGLLSDGNTLQISEEREWQINELKRFLALSHEQYQ
jgi:hypothetical protein